MFIKWDNPNSLVVPKSEAEARMTAIAADQLAKLRKEITRKDLLSQAEVLSLIDHEINRILGLPPEVGNPVNRKGFVIACTAKGRGGEGQNTEGLRFLVDRGRIRHSWWSDELEDALVFDHQEAAERKCATLHHNNPTVMPYSHAESVVACFAEEVTA